MIPYRDTIPCRYTPWITWTLIAVNGLIFLYSSLLSERVRGELFYRYGLVPARYTWSGWEQWAHLTAPDYASFITSMFLHGSWMHLIMNMWLLWIFGDNVEDRMGGVRFISFYLLCGLFAGILQIYFSPSSLVPTVGASGAIAGVMGAFFFLYPYARIVIWVFFLPLFVPVPAIGFVGVWVILQLYKATTGFVNAAGYADVAWWGHVGGFIAGTLSYRLFLLWERRPGNAR
ncbi:rhomboid family intramembrane serine protease [Methylolobus aquaticus]|nr:rhomboid family intramembrane serine protease [Methylolobus aquaticus]